VIIRAGAPVVVFMLGECLSNWACAVASTPVRVVHPRDPCRADGRPLDGCGVTRDLKRLLTRTWIGGRQECKHPRVVNRQCADCNAEQLPPLSFHALRHSCASIRLAQGLPVRDVAEILGHSDVRLTLSTYAHVI
jgi:integrase